MVTDKVEKIAEICWNSVENFWGENFGGWFDPVTSPLLNTALYAADKYNANC